ncbi:MAG: toll/interleukin-1 receptor domain-containing protein [Oculatellaceae cyanobacterium bins.114]|nr:toll/interleukin-1 receptor domain-containing protein [Oculatellaceae cyanobacterium bins.114]
MFTPNKLIDVFFAYSRKDEELRNELEKHLSHLVRSGWIIGWHDRKIGAGEEWESKIDDYLNRADIILLLISADFIASDYCYGIEMEQALIRHSAGDAHVIPVILRPVDWEGTPFSHLQALPKDAKPVTSWVNRDEAFVSIAQGIRATVQEILRSEEAHQQLQQTASRSQVPLKKDYEALPPEPVLIDALETTEAVSIEPEEEKNSFKPLMAGVYGSVVLLTAILGLQFVPQWLKRQPSITVSPVPSPIPTPSATLFNADVFGTVDTVALTEVAINRFSNNDLEMGQQAVTALLERGAVQEAVAALEAVPKDYLERPEINFLRGRVGWEYLKRGDPDYSFGDVIRFWDRVVKAEPDVPQYQIALGFAYYIDGNSELAIATLCQALNTIQAQNTTNSQESESNCSVPASPVTNEDELNAIAGLALAYKQGSERGTLEADPEAAMSQALQFYQAVMGSDPVQFQPDQLDKTWLWTESAVNEWRSLGTR